MQVRTAIEFERCSRGVLRGAMENAFMIWEQSAAGAPAIDRGRTTYRAECETRLVEMERPSRPLIHPTPSSISTLASTRRPHAAA